MISTMGGVLVGDHLTWRHWAEDVLLALHLEDVVVRLAVVYDSSIEFPWPSKEKMKNGRWNDVALQGVFVGADFEGDLYSVLNLDSARVSKPLHFVWMWVLRLGQLELREKFFTCEVMTTPSIDDDLDEPSIDAGLGMKDMASLVFFLDGHGNSIEESSTMGVQTTIASRCKERSLCYDLCLQAK